MKRVTKRLWINCTWTAAILSLMIGMTLEAKAGSGTVYATADNGVNFLFGTVNLSTGQFSQIATTTPLFASLTAGSGGTLYGAAGFGIPNYGLYSITPSGVPSQFGSVTAPSTDLFPGFLGLASQGAAGFYADHVTAANTAFSSPITATLVHISADGNSSTVVGTMGTTFGSYNSGNLTFGPDGKLYFDCWNTYPADVATLYSINTTTGAATAIGTGLGTLFNDFLTMTTVGNTLYGIDTYAPEGPSGGPSIYTINTTTGAATAIGSVSGLPVGYTLDTLASVPEPSTITLLVSGVLGALGIARRRRSA